MVINYIYLILILILITSINYFIYLSYEYRGTGMNSNNNTETNTEINKYEDNVLNNNFQTEHFLDLPVIIPNINNNDKQIKKLLESQQKALDNIYNFKILSDNNDYINLSNQLKINKDNSNILIKKQNSLVPIPKTFPIDKLINTIKSKYNSQYLSLFSNDINKYGVLINDKCFTVDGLSKDGFSAKKCQKNLYISDSQKFYTDRIKSSDDIVRIMKIPRDKISTNNIYPFNIFRSKVNDKCLSINNNGLGIEECNLNNIQQQWLISPNENICVLK